MIAICGCFCSPEGVLNSSCGNYGSFDLGMALSRLWGGLWALSKVESLAHTHTSPSEVYPAGELQWHFTFGFDFKHFCSPEGVNYLLFLKIIVQFTLQCPLQMNLHLFIFQKIDFFYYYLLYFNLVWNSYVKKNRFTIYFTPNNARIEY